MAIEEYAVNVYFEATQLLIFSMILVYMLRKYKANFNGVLLKTLILYDVLMLAKLLNSIVMFWLVKPIILQHEVDQSNEPDYVPFSSQLLAMEI